MNTSTLFPALLAASFATTLIYFGTGAEAFSIAGPPMPAADRHFRVHNNFTSASANNNQVQDPNLPGYTGATLAIWKGVAEWGSSLHGVGDGDPHQPGDLGSGGANFDPLFQGESPTIGAPNGNVFSEIPGSGGGVLAFVEQPPGGGWRVRFYSDFLWSDGPGDPVGSEIDLQAITCRIYGNILGLGSSSVTGATMSNNVTPHVNARSIELDDQAGVQAIYGHASAGKAIITGYSIVGSQIEVRGANFAAAGNTLLFTPVGPTPSGIPIRVSGLPSTGSLLVAQIPAAAGSGDIQVQRSGPTFADLSNAWPTSLSFGTPCPAPQLYCNSLPNSTGAVASISWTGEARILSTNDLLLTVGGAPAGENGLFFFGPTQVSFAFGDGIRCVGGPVTRMPLLTTDASGSASQPVDLQGPPFNDGSHSTSIGDALHFQFWFRDPSGAGSGFNTSDGVRVEVCP